MTEPRVDLIDIGVNLGHDSFDRDRDQVLQRAAAAGVRRLVVTGTTVAASHKAVALARSEPGRLYATAGVHPHHATELDSAAITELTGVAADDVIVAVGECGLDYFRDYSPRDIQCEAFAAQLAIAVATGKPVFLHQRDAHADFVHILRKRIDKIRGGVAHCFTGGPDEMHEYLEMGLHIGITGWICDERRGHDLQAAVRELPLDRVLLETDAPYLLPRDLPEAPRGRRNEPAHLRHILNATARFMGCEPEELATAATRNTERLFGLPERNRG